MCCWSPCTDHEHLLEEFRAAFEPEAMPESPIVVYWAEHSWDGRKLESGLAGAKWRELDTMSLRQYPDGLSYFVPIAWKYYLPAYLTASLNYGKADVLEDKALDTLDPNRRVISPDTTLDCRLPYLSSSQKRVVKAYTEHLWEKHEDSFGLNHLWSVCEYWQRF